MRYLIRLILLNLSLFVITSFANAEISQIGDGRQYYCESEVDDDYLLIYLVKVSSNTDVSFKKAINKLNNKIESVKNKIRRGYGNLTQLRSLLKSLKNLKSDIRKCYYNGTTGKLVSSNPPSDTTPPVDNTPVSSDLACSIAGDSSGRNIRIIGGTQCRIGNSPVVYLDLLNSNGASAGACTGTVVRNSAQTYGRTVIFAAHCVEGVSAVKVKTPQGEYTAAGFAYYPGWPNGVATEDGDVAIAVFNYDLPTRAVRLSTSNSQIGDTGVIAGYGVDENNNANQDRLKAGIVGVVQNSGYGIAISYNGGNTANTCFGDSGGPLFINRGTDWVLAGVTSNGVRNDCGVGDTSYFANLLDPKVANWINSVVPGIYN